jgi:hypothetical protein
VRWVSNLQDYNFSMYHILGKANTRADLLSHSPDHFCREDDNKEVVALGPEMFQQILHMVDLSDQTLKEEMREAKPLTKEVV